MDFDHYRAVEYLFDYFYRKVHKNPNYKLIIDDRYSAMINNFIKLVRKNYNIHSIGMNFYLSYFSYSFEYWATLTTKRNITLGWIIGKKMFDRWLNKADSADYYVDKFIREYGVDVNEIRMELSQRSDKVNPLSIHASEEEEKVRHTGEARLYHCLINTTLYNHRSINCLGCMNRTVCKRLLKKNNPQLYKKRGYV